MAIDLGPVIRKSGLLDTLQPVEQMRQREDVAMVIMRGGGIFPEAAAPLRTPPVLRWGPSDTGPFPVAQNSTAELFWAYAATPPNLGNCVVTLTMITRGEGEKAIGSLTIPNGEQFGETPLNYVLPARAAVFATVTTANGASGVTRAVFVKAS